MGGLRTAGLRAGDGKTTEARRGPRAITNTAGSIREFEPVSGPLGLPNPSSRAPLNECFEGTCTDPNGTTNRGGATKPSCNRPRRQGARTSGKQESAHRRRGLPGERRLWGDVLATLATENL